MHDRVPAQREEHPGQELPVPGRAGRREVHPQATASTVRPLRGGGYAVDTVRTGAWRARRTARTFTAGQVVFAAGTWGTQQLLHRMRADGVLPGISARVGVLTRTNSEALGGALTTMRHRKKHDFTRGVPSPHPSTRMSTPTSSPSVTARARTRWGCSAR